MLTFMSYTATQRQQIADAVRRTRTSQKLDKEPAARAADVNSITWKKIEDGHSVRDTSLQKVLTSLGLPTADEIVQTNHTASAPDAHTRNEIAVREDIERAWASAIEFADGLVTIDQPVEVRENAFNFLRLFSGILADRVIAADISSANRDALLELIYENRREIAAKLGVAPTEGHLDGRSDDAT